MAEGDGTWQWATTNKKKKKRLPVIGEDVNHNERKLSDRIESMSFELIEIMNDPFGRFRSARKKMSMNKKHEITPFPARRKFHICSVCYRLRIFGVIIGSVRTIAKLQEKMKKEHELLAEVSSLDFRF